jgi:hypothetical protein
MRCKYTYPRNSEKDFKGIRMEPLPAPWWHWALSFCASMFMMTLSFCRSNSKEMFGIEKINPFYWWFFVGWLTTYVGIKNWEFTRGQLGPVHALIFFTVVEVIFDVIAYSCLFGFRLKYVAAIVLVVTAVLIMSWPDKKEDEAVPTRNKASECGAPPSQHGPDKKGAPCK